MLHSFLKCLGNCIERAHRKSFRHIAQQLPGGTECVICHYHKKSVEIRNAAAKRIRRVDIKRHTAEVHAVIGREKLCRLHVVNGKRVAAVCLHGLFKSLAALPVDVTHKR